MTSPITKRARDLRNSPTDAEKLLWRALKESNFNIKFRRQYPIGPYFADIVCKDINLVIEIDGGQHDELLDKKRTDYLQKQGYRVTRFWNNEVLGNIEGVMAEIVNIMDTPPLPPRSRGGSMEGH